MRNQGGLAAGLWSFAFNLAISFGIAAALSAAAVMRFESWDMGIWIYSFVIAFAISDAVEKKSVLKEHIEIELNTLRHLTRLVQHLGNAAWKKSMFASIQKYQTAIANAFPQYLASTPTFREISDAVYSYRPQDERETVVLSEVMVTIRQLSEVREHIHHGMEARIGWMHWVRLGFSCAGLLIVLFLPKETLEMRRVALGISIFTLLLPFDILYHSSTLSSRRLQRLEARYRKNIERIERIR